MPTSSAEDRDQRSHLRLTAVAAGYGTAPVIQDVSLTVALGEVATVIGPNGAGKSTLLKTVLGILRPSSGEITLAGGRITGLPANQVIRRGVGYVPQVKDVFEPLTVKENLEMGGYLLPAASRRSGTAIPRSPRCATARPGTSAAASASCWRWAGS
jgi:ABC-type branched-subunit amino acid transport system ATPase component